LTQKVKRIISHKGRKKVEGKGGVQRQHRSWEWYVRYGQKKGQKAEGNARL